MYWRVKNSDAFKALICLFEQANMTTTESTNDVRLRTIPVWYPLIWDAETIICNRLTSWHHLDQPNRWIWYETIYLSNQFDDVSGADVTHFNFNVSVISTRQRWENWKGTGGFWIISFICFSNEIDPIVISCLLQSFRRDLKNAIKSCRSQMKTFLTEYLDLMIIWTTISTLDWILTKHWLICVYFICP